MDLSIFVIPTDLLFFDMNLEAIGVICRSFYRQIFESPDFCVLISAFLLNEEPSITIFIVLLNLRSKRHVFYLLPEIVGMIIERADILLF